MRVRQVAGMALAMAGGALAAAFVAEWYLHLVPCALCLVERWPYRVSIGLALLALVLPRRLWLVLAVAALMVAAGLGLVHVGVEQGWWPSPLPECAAPHLSGSIADRLAAMPDRPSKPCDEPTFLIPGLPLSMASMNMLYALLCAGVLSFALAGAQRRRKR
jgi:disulfide bond formation protein DsbB